MNAMAITELVVALAVVAAALAAFNWLVGKGPRGAVWLVAAGVVSWSTFLSGFLTENGELVVSRELMLMLEVLQLCGAVGFVVGVADVLQPRNETSRHPIADFFIWQPFLWAAFFFCNFYALLYAGAFHSPLLFEYCAGHEIAKFEVAAFFIGLAAVLLRLCETASQFPSLREPLLSPVPLGGQRVEDCDELLAQLREKPALQHSFLVRRLRDAIEFVRRKNSADALDSHLRHLEELESVRANGAYAMVRIIIWAIPILGLLGTVIGITMAVANLNPQTLEESVSKVTRGLNVAFEHTATALTLTMALMFIKSAVERLEDRLLARVDERTAEELVGRFQSTSPESIPTQRNTIGDNSRQIVDAIESLAGRQAEVWRATIDDAHEQWLGASVAAAKTIKAALSEAVQESLSHHAQTLQESSLRLAEQMTAAASQHSEHLDRSAQQTSARLRDGLEKLAELLIEALERHGEVLTATEKDLSEQNRQHLSEVEAALGRSMASAAQRQENLVRQSENLLKEMQLALVEAAGATVRQQEQLVRQGDVLLKVVGATGQIKSLEDALVQNLAAVRESHNFEEMAINLSAAIQLLSARLGHLPPGARSRELAGGNAAKDAA